MRCDVMTDYLKKQTLPARRKLLDVKKQEKKPKL